MSANSDGSLVKVRDLRKSFGQNQVLRGVDLDVARGEVVSVIGSSGSGKTTMLRCVNLLETYDSGSITVDGVAKGRRAAAAESATSRAFAPTSAWCFSCSICSRISPRERT
jgi:polar amino acid transport system ATP-binding protein